MSEDIQRGESLVVSWYNKNNSEVMRGRAIGTYYPVQVQDVLSTIPDDLNAKATFLQSLELDTTTAANIQALCIYYAKIYNFSDRRADFVRWAQKVIKIDDEGNIEHKAAVGEMLNRFKADAETFVYLMSIPYAKNRILSGVSKKDGFKRFLKNHKDDIPTWTRDQLVYEKRRIFYPDTMTGNDDGKSEQLTFDFAGIETLSLSAQQDPEKVVKTLVRKLKHKNVPNFMHGSLTMGAAAVTFWEEHPEARPSDIASYTAFVADMYQALKAITPEEQK